MIDMLLPILSSFIAVYAGGVMLNAPKKFLIPAGFGGTVCWLLYIIFIPISGAMMANFYSSIGVALYSHIMARIYKTPVTIFFIPGFLPIVPGVTMFRMVYYYISGNPDKFSLYLSETIQIATLIALAIILTDAFFRSLKKIKYLQKK